VNDRGYQHSSTSNPKIRIAPPLESNQPHNACMAIKAVVVDDGNTQHRIIGLNRNKINSMLDGDVFTLPHGIPISLTEQSDIVLLFAETDEDLEKRFPPALRPV
jgi:hypothetical protein